MCAWHRGACFATQRQLDCRVFTIKPTQPEVRIGMRGGMGLTPRHAMYASEHRLRLIAGKGSRALPTPFLGFENRDIANILAE